MNLELGRGALSAGTKGGMRLVWKIMRKSRRDRGIVDGGVSYVMTNKTWARGEGNGVEDAQRDRLVYRNNPLLAILPQAHPCP